MADTVTLELFSDYDDHGVISVPCVLKNFARTMTSTSR